MKTCKNCSGIWIWGYQEYLPLGKWKVVNIVQDFAFEVTKGTLLRPRKRKVVKIVQDFGFEVTKKPHHLDLCAGNWYVETNRCINPTFASRVSMHMKVEKIFIIFMWVAESKYRLINDENVEWMMKINI